MLGIFGSGKTVSRRQFLRGSLLNGVKIGAAVWLAEAGGQVLDLIEQRETWREASLPNDEFLARHGDKLQKLTLGASFAPEQWPLDPRGAREALYGLSLVTRELSIREMRLGLRWSRVETRDGNLNLRNYDQYIEHCLEQGSNICLNLGPIKTFRWPEDHVPRHVLASLDNPPRAGAKLDLQTPLVGRALHYLDRLLPRLQDAYGPSRFPMLQVENEPFYPLGEHSWKLDRDYLEVAVKRVAAAYPEASVLISSAGRLNLNSIRDLFLDLMRQDPSFRGRLVSGFDFHYRTPLRDSYPIVRYFDQISYARPFSASCEAHINDARQAGFRIEVTEGQAEPYAYLTQPGNSARDFRYMLLRCLDNVLDPEQPALIRIWGVEELAKKMLRNQLTEEHLAIIELIQAINERPDSGVGPSPLQGA